MSPKQDSGTGPTWVDRAEWPWRWQHVYRISDVPGLGDSGGMHLEWELRDGRPVVVGLYVHGDELTTGTLRALPLGRVVAASSNGRAADLHRPHPDSDSQPEPEPSEPTTADLRAEVKRLRRRGAAWQAGRADKAEHDYQLALGWVEVERGHGLSATFFRTFANLYSIAAARSSAPARSIAADLGVPVATVHRWTREARLAGALPPARKGAAG